MDCIASSDGYYSCAGDSCEDKFWLTPDPFFLDLDSSVFRTASRTILVMEQGTVPKDSPRIPRNPDCRSGGCLCLPNTFHGGIREQIYEAGSLSDLPVYIGMYGSH